AVATCPRRRSNRMKRRKFITLLGSAAAASSHGVHAQQPPMPVIGYVGTGSDQGRERLVDFRAGLNEMGFTEGSVLMRPRGPACPPNASVAPAGPHTGPRRSVGEHRSPSVTRRSLGRPPRLQRPKPFPQSAAEPFDAAAHVLPHPIAQPTACT